MEVTVFRTKMVGGGWSYSVYVPLKSIPWADKMRGGYTIIEGEQYVLYEQGTLPESHYDLEPGPERYDRWVAHEKGCQAAKLAILHEAFPETRVVDKCPTLWLNNLDLGPEAGHAKRVVTV